jgi:hypothetical protein
MLSPDLDVNFLPLPPPLTITQSAFNTSHRFFRLHNPETVCHHTRMLLSDRKIAIHVLLRLTAMDVCCGPPSC